jgi:hypothetical protein
VTSWPGCGRRRSDPVSDDEQWPILSEAAEEIERLRAALREIRALHEPEWGVCALCGTADGHWPCDTIDTIREVLGDE